MISDIVNEYIFENWIPYLSEEDYENLVEMLESFDVKSQPINFLLLFFLLK